LNVLLLNSGFRSGSGYVSKQVSAIIGIVSEFLELHAMIFENILPLYWYR